MKSPFSWKGLLTGALLSCLVGVAAPYSMLVLEGSFMAKNSSEPGAIFLFLIVILFINLVPAILRRRYALSRADLVLVYIMLLMAITVPTQPFVGLLIPVISAVLYYASPENRWGDIFLPDIESWLVPQSEDAIQYLHEGLPPGADIPWGAWLTPLSAWSSFFLALCLLMISLGVILHRQWSVHERLAYPMVQLPLSMIEEPDGPLGRFGPFFSNGLMWIGFLVPFTVLSVTAIQNHYHGSLTSMPWAVAYIEMAGGSVWAEVWLTYAWVGFFYLVSLEITFSIWFFFWIAKLENILFNTLGVSGSEQLSLYAYSQTADLTHQSMGACLAFVLFGLWAGRRHFADVLHKAWGSRRGSDLQDSEELISYRTAFVGFAGSLLFVAGWLWATGIPVIVLPLFLATCIIFYIMVTRIVAAAGVVGARPPMVAAFFLISGVGTSVIGSQGLVALTLTYVWQAEMRLFPMIAIANSLKLAEVIRGPKGRLFWGMMIALVCSLAGGIFIILTMAYQYGGINLNQYFMIGQGTRVFTDMARPILNPSLPDMRGWLFTGLGAAVEGLLMLAQHRLHWWPLHPLGFVICVGWMSGQIWFSVFVAWLLKLSILRYGGIVLFHKLKPFFLGLILGEATVAGSWLVVDWITGFRGNLISPM